MNIEDIYRSASEGHRKAKRDVKLSKKHLKANGNNLDVSDTFWALLGKDVNRNDRVEEAAYHATKVDFMDKWARENPLEMVSAAFESHARQVDKRQGLMEEGGPLARPIVVQNDDNLRQNLVVAYGDDLTEENIDKLARSSIHEHMTREDECEPIRILRAALQWKNEQGS